MIKEDVIKNLRRNNFIVEVVKDGKEAVAYVKRTVPRMSLCSSGGSMTLNETGIMDLLRSGEYDFIDRYAPGIDKDKAFHDAFFSDYYFASANAITEHGEVYEVDATGNRVSAIIYGPKHVILVVGRNKIVKNLKEAIERLNTVATPLNAKRLSSESYCKDHGKCMFPEMDEEHLMCPGKCLDPLCSTAVIMSKQRVKDRITILLVDEDLGY